MDKYHIDIVVDVQFQEEKSDWINDLYRFAYRIRLTNKGAVTVKLLTRHWIIKDALGNVEEVRGQGVVGEQPILEPGQTYEYHSHVQIKTPMGTMSGSYKWEDDESEQFDTSIPEFALQMPRIIH